MKPAISVIFSILTALVLAAGGYLGFATWRDSKSLMIQRDSLQARVDSLNAVIATRGFRADQTSKLGAELDSIKIALKASEESISERFTRRGQLNAKAVISDSQKLEGIYPFKLTVEGNASSVDSFMTAFQADLPLARFEKLEGVRKGKNLRLEATGSVRFPR